MATRRKKSSAKRLIVVGFKKCGRWLRAYLKRIRATEREIGGELHAC